MKKTKLKCIITNDVKGETHIRIKGNCQDKDVPFLLLQAVLEFNGYNDSEIRAIAKDLCDQEAENSKEK